MTENKCFYCLASSSELCKDCGLVYYCCGQHLKLHQSKDGSKCFPFVVHHGGEDVGRYLRASRDIKPFEIVLTDDVVGLGVFDDSKPVCLSCLQRIQATGFTTCPHCRMPMCDKPECLTSEIHKPECEILRNYPESKKLVDGSLDDIHPVYALIGPLRILRWKKAEPGVWSEILKLSSHLEERRQDIRWSWVVHSILPIAEESGVPKEDLDFLELVFGIARTNALSLYKTVGESPGYALCTLFSLLNHSCMANCRYDISRDNSQVVIRAARLISSGEELCIQYKDPLVGNVLSSIAFKHHWMFTCKCKRCSDPTECGSYLSAFKCQHERECPGYLLPIDSLDPDSDWQCDFNPHGHQVVKAQNILEAVDRLKKQVDKLTYKDSVQDWEDILKKLLTNVHENHFLAMNAKRMLIQLYGTQVEFNKKNPETLSLVLRKLDLCENFLQVYDKVDLGYSKWRGRILEEMATPFIISKLTKLQGGLISKAEYAKAYISGVRMIKEAARCRQYDTRDETDSLFAVYIRKFNDAIEMFSV